MNTYCECGKYQGGPVIGNTFYCANCGKERSPTPQPSGTANEWDLVFLHALSKQRRPFGGAVLFFSRNSPLKVDC